MLKLAVAHSLFDFTSGLSWAFILVGFGGLLVSFYIFGGFQALWEAHQRKVASDVAKSFRDSAE